MTGPVEPVIEVITRRPVEPAGTVPLLFVHGAFAGAWCWDEHFLPWFAERGYAAHALSLRGHGESDGRPGIDGWGLEDYVEDVARVIESLDRPPVLIGHSMGGFVVQKLLEIGEAAGAVLMASVPPRGLSGPGLSLAVWNPSVAFSIGSIQSLGEVWGSPATMQDALFSDSFPRDRAMQYLGRMGRESTRAMMEMFGGGLAWRGDTSAVPVQVMGAADDALIPPAFVRATARAYGVTPQLLDDIGHLMMLDLGWERAARCLLDWLHENAL